MPTTNEIVIAEAAPTEKRVFGLVRRRRLPQPRESARLYGLERRPDGSSELREIVPGAPDAGLDARPWSVFYHVSISPCPVRLGFFQVSDLDGNRLDLQICGHLLACNPRQFLQSCAIDLVTLESPFSADKAASWIVPRVAAKVGDAVREYRWDDLKVRNALPVGWWQTRLGEWLQDCGIEIHVQEVSWSSPDKEAAEAAAARQEHLKRIAHAREQERAAELREAEAKADYERKKAEIEADAIAGERVKAQRLEVLEKQHAEELIEAQTRIENAKRAADRAALEHELAMARLRADAEAIQKASARADESHRRHQAVLQELDAMRTALARLPGEFLAQLASKDADNAHKAAERLVSPEFNVPPAALARLGYRVDRQALVQSLREKAARDGEPVRIWKQELITRDIGTTKVKALPVNTSLQFEFSTARSGCVTLLNFGTSNAVYVHVPNAYVGVAGATAKSGRSYFVPGPELLPWEALRRRGLDYVEIGPPNWEHLVVLISEKPLLKADVLARTSGHSPFVKLNADEIAEMCGRLSEQPDDQWSAGVLSFLVG